MTFPLARGLLSIQQTPAILQALLRDVDETRARQARDGAGWNVIEILCHLNDVEIVLGDRMKISSADNPPAFPPLDPEVYPIDDDPRFVIELLRATRVLVTNGRGFNLPGVVEGDAGHGEQDHPHQAEGGADPMPLVQELDETGTAVRRGVP